MSNGGYLLNTNNPETDSPIINWKQATIEQFRIHYQSYTWTGKAPTTFVITVPSAFNVPANWQRVPGSQPTYQLTAADLSGVTANAGDHDLTLSLASFKALQAANMDLVFSDWRPPIGTLNIWPRLTVKFVDKASGLLIDQFVSDDAHPAKTGRYYVDLSIGCGLVAGEVNYVDYDLNENQPVITVPVTRLK